MPEELVPVAELDYVFRGEGEVSFVHLVEAIERGQRPAEKIVIGEPPDLDTIPYPDRELFKAQEQPWWLTGKTPFVTIIAGRGCVYNCSYCQPAERIMFGKKVRRRSVDNVIGELKMLRDRYHFNAFMFHDDCLIEDPAWVRQFCHRYREEGFHQEFICQGRADLICRHRDLIAGMRSAGLVGLIIGFESGSQRVLNFVRKGVKVEQNFEAAAICRELGIKIQANYMLGLPTETKDEIRETLAMIAKINPYMHSRGIFTPSPGSDLFDYCVKNGLVIFTSHDDYRRDLYQINKIKGVDYAFIEREIRRLDSQRISLPKRIVNAVIWYVMRKNRFTLTVLKRCMKISALRALAHAVVRNTGS
jgi:radical SAM superfamily enzyme YgiQ (UPF0313 family)